jgi:septum formation topological specificity factor MinE
MNMTSFLSFLIGEKEKTANVAKERLQIILAHERTGGSHKPDSTSILMTFGSTWSVKTTWMCWKSR